MLDGILSTYSVFLQECVECSNLGIQNHRGGCFASEEVSKITKWTRASGINSSLFLHRTWADVPTCKSSIISVRPFSPSNRDHLVLIAPCNFHLFGLLGFHLPSLVPPRNSSKLADDVESAVDIFWLDAYFHTCYAGKKFASIKAKDSLWLLHIVPIEHLKKWIYLNLSKNDGRNNFSEIHQM